MRSDWLEAFVVFSTHMNFTHAADALHISQPALHTKIRQLGTRHLREGGVHVGKPNRRCVRSARRVGVAIPHSSAWPSYDKRNPVSSLVNGTFITPERARCDIAGLFRAIIARENDHGVFR